MAIDQAASPTTRMSAPAPSPTTHSAVERLESSPPSRAVRGSVRATGRLVERAPQNHAVEQRERRDQDDGSDGETHQHGDQRGAARGRPIHGEPWQDVGVLRQCPARDHRGDGHHRDDARRLETARGDETQRRDAGQSRDDDRGDRGPARELVPELFRIGAHHDQGSECDASGDERRHQGPHAEGLDQIGAADARSIRREPNRGDVDGDRHGEDADGDRSRVEPAREQVPACIAGRHAARGDRADRRRRARTG